MMGVGVGCMDEKHITFDDRKKKRITFDDGRGEEEEGEVRIKVLRTRVHPEGSCRRLKCTSVSKLIVVGRKSPPC